MAMLASRNPDDAFTNAAPMYITVGPQCCGKTTLLQQLPQPPVDISLDDQPDVYVPVPTHEFWVASESSSQMKTEYQGKTLHDRILQDNTELRLVLQRIQGDLSQQNFAIRLLQHYQEKRLSIDVAQTLIQAVESYPQPLTLPNQTQVFILESLFQPHPDTNQTAIQRALAQLRKTPTYTPIAWGNTNSKPRDYQMALEIACQLRRPVRFVVSAPAGPSSVSIPWVSLSTLLQRNLQRFSECGKYIPANSIADCYHRIESLFSQNTTYMDLNQDPLAMERFLVDAVPAKNQRHNAGSYRYRLTRNRLIQKEYLSHPSNSTNNGKRPRDGTRRPPPYYHQETGRGGPYHRRSGNFTSRDRPPPPPPLRGMHSSSRPEWSQREDDGNEDYYRGPQKRIKAR